MNKVDNQVNNIAELLQKIPPIFTGKEKDSVQMKNVAHLKRAVEYYLYDPDFRKKFDNDADGTLKNYAIEASAKDVEIDPFKIGRINSPWGKPFSPNDYPQSPVVTFGGKSDSKPVFNYTSEEYKDFLKKEEEFKRSLVGDNSNE